AKVIQQGKLARLGRGFEHDRVEPEGFDKPIGVGSIQPSILIEQPDSLCAFTGFDDELDRTRVEPLLPLVDPHRQRVVVESPVVFFSKLHLNIEAATSGGGDNLTRIELALGESLTAFDASDADVRAQIEVCGKFSLRDGDFKRPSAGYG